MTRRRFLLGALGVLGSVFTSLLGGVGRASGLASAPSWIERDLRREFDYLRFADGVVEGFAVTYQATVPEFDPTEPEQRREMRQSFLLSTDFFQNGADERRLVRYVAFYDPYQTPCYNPFARIDAGR